MAEEMRPKRAAMHDSRLNRRRVLRVVAAGAGLPLMIAGIRAVAPKAKEYRWRGEVLGALSELSVWHTDPHFARAAILKVRLEAQRLENIFSLYRAGSEIVRLNAAGKLAKPSIELRTLIEEGRRLSELSGGAFDISVQPLWRLYEAHFWKHTDTQPDIAARAHDMARALVDFRKLDSGLAGIGFARPGMAITLNSIGQGYITDAAVTLLRNEGFESAVVDLGEFRTIGRHPDGQPWRLGIRDAKSADGIIGDVPLENMALAVSGGYGTTFEATGHFHHIFDPHTGESANRLLQVAVTGPDATRANGLATAIYVAGEAQAPRLLAAYPGTRAFLTRLDGSVAAIPAKAPATA